MFLDWKNQYCKNDYTTHSDLQIQFNPYQITNGIFHRIITKNFTICMETQRSQTDKAIMRKTNRGGGIRSGALASDCTTRVQSSRQWFWHKTRNTDPWNRTESWEVNPSTCGHLIYDKEGKNMPWRKHSFFSKLCWENWKATCQKKKN